MPSLSANSKLLPIPHFVLEALPVFLFSSWHVSQSEIINVVISIIYLLPPSFMLLTSHRSLYRRCTYPVGALTVGWQLTAAPVNDWLKWEVGGGRRAQKIGSLAVRSPNSVAQLCAVPWDLNRASLHLRPRSCLALPFFPALSCFHHFPNKSLKKFSSQKKKKILISGSASGKSDPWHPWLASWGTILLIPLEHILFLGSAYDLLPI